MEPQLPQNHRTSVFFRWSCDDLLPNEEVRVVGNLNELGNWKPGQGVVLEFDESSSCWVSNGVSLPLGKRALYKYMICDATKSVEEARWEPREENRSVVPSGYRHILEDDNGKYRLACRRNWSDGDHPVDHPVGTPISGNNSVPSSPLLPSGTHKSAERFDSSHGTKVCTIPVADDDEEKLTSSDTVFVVFRRLPFRVNRDKQGNWCVEESATERHFFTVVSLMQQIMKEAKQRDPVQHAYTIKYVGDPGFCPEDLEDRRRVAEVLAPHNCIPVFVKKDVSDKYKDFCQAFLWPLMHSVKVFEEVELENDRWGSYQAMNKAYADAIAPHLKPASLVWVHSYYLMLVPRYVHLRHPDCTIGFFMHSGFPTSEVMRCIPNREEILQSLLSCKVVTFQIFEHARHFLNSCQFMLSTTHNFQGGGVLQIEHDGRSIVVRADHFVLPFDRFLPYLDGERTKAKAAALRNKFGGKKLFASIDGNEPFAGMILKVRAFHKFLMDCPQHRRSVALLQHVVEDQERGNKDILLELKRVADEINHEFGQPNEPPVVEIGEGPLDASGRLGVLLATDVLLDTSINDGWNLQPFMFYCAHTADRRGVAIVSEFSGCSAFLTAAKKINPWNEQAVLDAMHEAVTMEAHEMENRFTRDHSYIASQRMEMWLHANVSELKRTQKQQTGPVTGLGAGRRLLLMEKGFRQLDIEPLLNAYKSSKCRAIFLDNEGTLAPKRGAYLKPYGAANLLSKRGQNLDPQVLDALRLLARDPCNTVVVISGRDKSFLDRSFGEVDGIGLCAEYGFYYVQPGKLARLGDTSERWKCITTDTEEDDDWKTIVFELMKMYVRRVQGSIIEYKGSAITWNYREVGAQQLAKEIALELTKFLDPTQPEGLLYGYKVSVIVGKGYLEVKRIDINKGIAIMRLLKEMAHQLGQVDFVLCIGDDRSDEDMFEAVNSATAEGLGDVRGTDSSKDLRSIDSGSSLALSGSPLAPLPEHTSPSQLPATPQGPLPASPPLGPALAPAPKGLGLSLRDRRKASVTTEDLHKPEKEKCNKYYSVTVGRKPSKAEYFVKDTDEVSNLLQKLAAQSTKLQLSRFSSMPAFPIFADDDEN